MQFSKQLFGALLVASIGLVFIASSANADRRYRWDYSQRFDEWTIVYTIKLELANVWEDLSRSLNDPLIEPDLDRAVDEIGRLQLDVLDLDRSYEREALMETLSDMMDTLDDRFLDEYQKIRRFETYWAIAEKTLDEVIAVNSNMDTFMEAWSRANRAIKSRSYYKTAELLEKARIVLTKYKRDRNVREASELIYSAQIIWAEGARFSRDRRAAQRYMAAALRWVLDSESFARGEGFGNGETGLEKFAVCDYEAEMNGVAPGIYRQAAKVTEALYMATLRRPANPIPHNLDCFNYRRVIVFKQEGLKGAGLELLDSVEFANSINYRGRNRGPRNHVEVLNNFYFYLLNRTKRNADNRQFFDSSAQQSYLPLVLRGQEDVVLEKILRGPEFARNFSFDWNN